MCKFAQTSRVFRGRRSGGFPLAVLAGDSCVVMMSRHETLLSTLSHFKVEHYFS